MVESSETSLPSGSDILRTRKIIAPFVHRTPVMQCSSIDALHGTRLFFKCENLQKGGAFKVRGATHAVMTLSDRDARRGVATHSSGNHAQALALTAGKRGIEAHIVMPENAPRIKIAAVSSYGGHIHFCRPTLRDRERTLKALTDKHGYLEIHPYNDYRIIAGQATVGAELFEDAPGLDYLVAPVGGGGLLSGAILAARYFSPGTKIIGAEPENANDAWQSFRNKRFIPSVRPKTIADGLRTSLGSLTFPIILDGAEDILTTSEDSIVRAMHLIWERMKIIVEPSGAVALATVLDHPVLFSGKCTGVILSGGNTDLYHIPWIDRQNLPH